MAVLSLCDVNLRVRLLLPHRVVCALQFASDDFNQVKRMLCRGLVAHGLHRGKERMPSPSRN